jgi:hypothetical protein
MILICAGTVSHADCQPDTALSVTRGPQISNEIACGLAAQTLIASTQLLHEGDYMKIICRPRAHDAERGIQLPKMPVSEN